MDFQQNILIAGMGKTGRSVADFLDSNAIQYQYCDDTHSHISCHENNLDSNHFIFKSPGIHPQIFSEIADQVVINDVELLLRLTNRPVFLVTGTNGKSTVITLIEMLLLASGINVIACGNNGVPVLEAYARNPDIYAIELSSYQLENLKSHQCDVATVLNIGVDHVDRYMNMAAYQCIKEKIYAYSRLVVEPVNNQGLLDYSNNQTGFRVSDTKTYCLKDDAIYRDDERYVDIGLIALAGRHNHLNICAALAMLDHIQLEKPVIESVLQNFTGLDHRMQLVCQSANGQHWINDSKSTNVHSTDAALRSLLQPVVLIMGGRGKGDKYSQMLKQNAAMISSLLVYGEDAQLIADQADSINDCQVVDTVLDAVSIAATCSDDVLFSPACASFDQYENFIARGNDFCHRVKQVVKC